MCYNTSTGYPSNGDRRRSRELDVELDNQRQPKRLRTVLDDNRAPEYEESIAAKESMGTAPLTNCAIPLTVHKSVEPSLSVLPIPSPGDTRAQIRSKLVALADVIVSGGSIALATGYAATTDPDNDAVKAAVSQMPPKELELWKYFVEGSSLPEIDWSKDQEPATTSPKSLKIACRRAEALNRLYKTDKANERHVAWLTKHRIVYLPLVKAMARVIGAERNLTGGNGGCSATQFADLQSINRILSLSSNITTADGLSKGLVDVTMAQQVLSRRRRELRALIRIKGGN